MKKLMRTMGALVVGLALCLPSVAWAQDPTTIEAWVQKLVADSKLEEPAENAKKDLKAYLEAALRKKPSLLVEYPALGAYLYKYELELKAADVDVVICRPVYPTVFQAGTRTSLGTDTRSVDPWYRGAYTADGANHCDELSHKQALTNGVFVATEDTLNIILYRGETPITFANVASIQVRSQVVGAQGTEVGGDVGIPIVDFEAVKEAESNFIPFRIGLQQLGGQPSSKLKLTVKITFEDGRVAETQRFVELERRTVGYGVDTESLYSRYKTNKIGVWAPVGLLGAHFRDIDAKAGMQFQATPIAVALGSKIPIRTGYLGISGILGYTIGEEAPKDEDDTTTSAPQDNSSEIGFNLTGITPGILFDINNLFYLGAGYTFDVRAFVKDSGLKHPGVGVFIGAPIGLGKGDEPN